MVRLGGRSAPTGSGRVSESIRNHPTRGTVSSNGTSGCRRGPSHLGNWLAWARITATRNRDRLLSWGGATVRILISGSLESLPCPFRWSPRARAVVSRSNILHTRSASRSAVGIVEQSPRLHRPRRHRPPRRMTPYPIARRTGPGKKSECLVGSQLVHCHSRRPPRPPNPCLQLGPPRCLARRRVCRKLLPWSL